MLLIKFCRRNFAEEQRNCQSQLSSVLTQRLYQCKVIDVAKGRGWAAEAGQNSGTQSKSLDEITSEIDLEPFTTNLQIWGTGNSELLTGLRVDPLFRETFFCTCFLILLLILHHRGCDK